jgi:hypothetical protein
MNVFMLKKTTTTTTTTTTISFNVHVNGGLKSEILTVETRGGH